MNCPEPEPGAAAMILSVYPAPEKPGQWGVFMAVGATDHRLELHPSRDLAVASARMLRDRSLAEGRATQLWIEADDGQRIRDWPPG